MMPAKPCQHKTLKPEGIVGLHTFFYKLALLHVILC
jgi:hypothetical protein